MDAYKFDIIIKDDGSIQLPYKVDLFHYMIPNFGHKETGKYLDGRM